MESEFPWYRELGAQERSWVGLVAQAGITAFVDWYRHPEQVGEITAGVFGSAPRELARVISLEQTVSLVRTTIDVVEEAIEDIDDLETRIPLREAVLRYSREIAFSAAGVYARAAEARGAWDARVEALVVDAFVRGDLDSTVLSRVSALGWSGQGSVLLIAGAPPIGEPELALAVLRRAAANHGLDLLTGIHGNVMLAIIGRVTQPSRVARLLSVHFGPGPIVASDSLDGLDDVPKAARSTMAALGVAGAWPAAPRPAITSDFLPELALAGDLDAKLALIAAIYLPLAAEETLLATASNFLESSPSLEATARTMFVHANTVRYRLRRITEITGYSPNEPRDAFALRMGLTLGRISQLDQ
ncbi:MAG: PucR family transcriptional regulator [Actinobacteria bacterium]|nr:PucR family transcriptional regulator [Actinomycetota bacterium]MTB28469.1 PucR family transcriptional regulator [Actinomycetota bacterium]